MPQMTIADIEARDAEIARLQGELARERDILGRERCVIREAYSEIDRLKGEIKRLEQVNRSIRIDKGNLEIKANNSEEAWRWACTRETHANNELAKARADTRRMDWLELYAQGVHFTDEPREVTRDKGHTLRDAIDRGRKLTGEMP